MPSQMRRWRTESSESPQTRPSPCPPLPPPRTDGVVTRPWLGDWRSDQQLLISVRLSRGVRGAAGRCWLLLAAGSGAGSSGQGRPAAACCCGQGGSQATAPLAPRYPSWGPCPKPPQGEHDSDLLWIDKGIWLGRLPLAGTTCPGSPVSAGREGLILEDVHSPARLNWQSPLRSRCFAKDRAVRGQRRALASCPHHGRLTTSSSSPASGSKAPVC